MEFKKMHENPAVLHVGTCPPRSYYLPKARCLSRRHGGGHLL